MRPREVQRPRPREVLRPRPREVQRPRPLREVFAVLLALVAERSRRGDGGDGERRTGDSEISRGGVGDCDGVCDRFRDTRSPLRTRNWYPISSTRMSSTRMTPLKLIKSYI